VVDEDGDVVASYDADEFGNSILLDENGASTDQRWVGGLGYKDETAATGLYYVRQRYYDPMLGRWLSRDHEPSFEELNPYLYVAASPVAFTDPLGLKKYDNWLAKSVDIDFLRNKITVLKRLYSHSQIHQAVRSGYDVLCRNRSIAQRVATDLGGGLPPEGPEIHGRGEVEGRQRFHYHPAGRPTGYGHILYGTTGFATLNVSGAPPPSSVPPSIGLLGGLLSRGLFVLGAANDAQRLMSGETLMNNPLRVRGQTDISGGFTPWGTFFISVPGDRPEPHACNQRGSTT
jgi:RHS repeat-associated protein